MYHRAGEVAQPCGAPKPYRDAAAAGATIDEQTGPRPHWGIA